MSKFVSWYLNSKIWALNVLIALFTLLFATQHASASEKLVLAGGRAVDSTENGTWLSMVYTDLFGQLGYDLQLTGYPSARASIIADSGKVDGEIHRVFQYQSAHPNLIRIQEPHSSLNIVAFAIRDDIHLDDWEDLANSDYTIGYRRGTEVVQRHLNSTINPNRISETSSTAKGLKKLLTGRTDIYIDGEDLIKETLAKLEPHRFRLSRAHQVAILTNVSMHLYLHKKNANLAPKISKLLKKMKQQGVLQEYRKLTHIKFKTQTDK